MRKTTTEFICDGCGKSHEKQGDLRKFRVGFRVEEHKLSGTFVAAASTELCTGCEKKLHVALEPLMLADEFEQIRGVVRDGS